LEKQLAVYYRSMTILALEELRELVAVLSQLIVLFD